VQFNTLPESSHELVVLRPIVAADLPVWYEYLSQPAVYEHTSWDVHSPDNLAPYVWNPEAVTPSSLLRLAIATRSTDRLVGTAGFHTVSPQNRSAELAYDLTPSLWGRGIASDVCALLVHWAHAEAGVARVQATVLESNLRSACVLQRCGFECEGLLRSYRMVRGRLGNFHMYSHLASSSAGV